MSIFQSAKKIEKSPIYYKSGNDFSNDNSINIEEVKKKSFWTSFITSLVVGVVSSLIATILYNHYFENEKNCNNQQIECLEESDSMNVSMSKETL